jgi:hypothetical protein
LFPACFNLLTFISIGGEISNILHAASAYSGRFLPDLSYISKDIFLTTDNIPPAIPVPLNIGRYS